MKNLLLSLSLLPGALFAQKPNLGIQVGKIASEARGAVGVSMMLLETGETFSFNSDTRYPMQSVFKLPLAMAVLDQVDKGKLSLDQKIHIRKEELLPTWSPIREKYPEGNVDLPIREILGYTVSQSDNNGCDILFRLLGGTANVNTYVHSIGIDSIAIVATEEGMASAWDVQFTNWAQTTAILHLLDVFNDGTYLSESSTAFLRKLMEATSTGKGRIRGLLPKDAVVANKTGTSGTNSKGVAGATNDVGIVTLPNGKHFAIVVFVCNAKADEKTRDAVIAKITRVFWDYYVDAK